MPQILLETRKNPSFPKRLSDIWIGGDLIISNRFGASNHLIAAPSWDTHIPSTLADRTPGFWPKEKSHVFSSNEFPTVPYRSWQPLPKPSSYSFSPIPWLKTTRVPSSGKTLFPFRESPSGKYYKTKQDQRCYSKIKMAVSISDHTSSFQLWTTEGLVEQQPRLFWVFSSHM